MNEFELIKHYFATFPAQRSDVVLGIGDDAALLQVPHDQCLVVAMDTLVSDVHFLATAAPYDIGYKALAVNLSDLAAMGAMPAWFTLALTLPKVDRDWLDHFQQGLLALSTQYNLQLIGGDTTRGPLTITIQAHGFVPAAQALRRDQAKLGDKIYVTGTLGDAGLALALQAGKTLPDNFSAAQKTYLAQRLNQPSARIEFGLALRDIAFCAIDISDGLAADLGHILTVSKVGATVCVDDLPLSAALKQNADESHAIELALTAGDDYELCFTVAPEKEAKLKQALANISCPYTCIGSIEQQPGLRLLRSNGRIYQLTQSGYQHF